MIEEGKKTEEILRRFVARPAPPEIKRHVLAAAGAARGQDAFFSRAQGRAAAALGVLMAASLVGDAWFEGRSARAWKALGLGHAYGSEAEAGMDKKMAREISGGDRNLERQILSRMDAETARKRFSRPATGALPGDI